MILVTALALAVTTSPSLHAAVAQLPPHKWAALAVLAAAAWIAWRELVAARVRRSRAGTKDEDDAIDATLAISRAVTATACAAFAGSAHYMLVVEPLRSHHHHDALAARDEPLMRRLLERTTPSQVAAMVTMSLSLVALLGGTGVAFLTAEFASGARRRRASAAASKPRAGLRMSQPAGFAVVVLALETAYVVWVCGRAAWRRAASPAEPPVDVTGLLWGLFWAGAGQVLVLTYHFARRVLGWCRAGYPPFQPTRPPSYEAGFAAQAVKHFAQPSAFALMGAYLSGAWIARLMPDSYYDYHAPVDWMHVVLQLVVVDLFTVVNHLAEHALPPLYVESHKPHHRYVSPQLFDAFDGSLADTTMLILLPLFCTMRALSFVATWSYIAFGFVYSTWFLLIHSEWPHPLDGLAGAVGVYTARDHHGHHALFTKNFAHFFTYWDRALGTFEVFADAGAARDE